MGKLATERSIVLAEREHVGLDDGGEECDLKGPVGGRSGRANELIEPRLRNGSVASFVTTRPWSSYFLAHART